MGRQREKGREGKNCGRKVPRLRREVSPTAWKESSEQGRREPGPEDRCWRQDRVRRGLGVGDTEGFTQTPCDLSALRSCPRAFGGHGEASGPGLIKLST